MLMLLDLNEKLLFFYCLIDDNTDAIQMLCVVYKHRKYFCYTQDTLISEFTKSEPYKEQVRPLGLFSQGKRRLRETSSGSPSFS